MAAAVVAAVVVEDVKTAMLVFATKVLRSMV